MGIYASCLHWGACHQQIICSAKIFKSLNPSRTLQLTTWRCRPSRCATRGGTPGTRSRTRSSRRRRAAARTASWWRPAGRGRSGQRRSGYNGAPGGEFLNCDIDIHYKRRCLNIYAFTIMGKFTVYSLFDYSLEINLISAVRIDQLS